MTARLSRLNELSAYLGQVIELGRYDEDEGDNRMLKDAAILGIGAAGTGAAGLYLRNRGDAVNDAKYAEIKKSGASPLVPGIKREATGAEFRGGNLSAIKTGAKDASTGIRTKLSDLLSKMKISRAVVKASAKHENLVELDAIPTKAKVELSTELDKVINLDIEDGAIGAGLVGAGGFGAYGLHQKGAAKKITREELREHMRGSQSGLNMSGARRSAVRQAHAEQFLKNGRGMFGNIITGGGEVVKDAAGSIAKIANRFAK